MDPLIEDFASHYEVNTFPTKWKIIQRGISWKYNMIMFALQKYCSGSCDEEELEVVRFKGMQNSWDTFVSPRENQLRNDKVLN